MSRPSHHKPTELLERMRAVTREQPGRQEGTPPVATVPSAGEATPRVRYTLDLSKEQHRFLKQFALDAEADASAILRALLALLQTDQELAGRAIALVQRKG